MKRKRELEPVAGEEKRAKKGEDPYGKFLSLVAVEDTVIAGLTYFLTTSRRNEGSPSLIETYLHRCPECDHILSPLGWGRDRLTHDVLLLCFECLQQVLLFTASTDSLPSTVSNLAPSVGLKLVLSIVRNHMRPVYSSLVTTVPMKLVAACLKLLAAMVAQGPRSARELQQVFNFGYKPLGFLPQKTHKIQGTEDSVRMCFVKFAFSFLVIGGDDVIRAILELKGFLSSVFTLLPKDPVETVHFILSTLMQRVILNPQISKKLKSLFFKQYVLKQTAQLLLHREEEHLQTTDDVTGTSEFISLGQFVFQFLLKLCTDFQLGICYRSKDIPLGLERTNNPAILQLLLSLSSSFTTCPLAQELAIRTVVTCPDLMLSYLRSISLSFEPRPTSKWVTNMEFLITLFSALPPLPQLLVIDKTLSSHLTVCLGFTVPTVTSRSMLSQGIQNSAPLVRFKTLSLMQLILKRATAVAEHFRAQKTIASHCVQYSDGVLKSLPDIKTVITLRQQLSGRGTPTGLKVEAAFLTPDEVLQNAELAESTSLLALTLEVMQGYQKLSRTIFAQVDFNVAKLLSPPYHGNKAERCDPEVVVPTLRLLLDAPSDSLKWQQQGSVTLSSIVWLYLGTDARVAEVSLELILKLLLGTDAFRGYDLDLRIVLSALKIHHFTATLATPDDAHLVSFVSSVLLATVRDPYTHTESVERILYESMEGDEKEESMQYSLQEILDAPVEMPELLSVEASDKCTKGPDGRNAAATTCPLVPCLLSQFAEMEPGPLVLFVSATLVRLLLVQESYELFARVVIDYLSAEAMKEQYLPGGWSGLYTSLLEFFSAWLPGSISKAAKSAMEASAKMPVKNVQKRITKLSEPSADVNDVFKLLSSLRMKDFIRSLPLITGTREMQQMLVHYATIRPMGLLGNADSHHIANLLESLPFSFVLIHGVTQLSNQTPPKEYLPQGRSVALLALIDVLNHSGLRELLKHRIQVATEDHLELVCSVNAILKLLEMINKCPCTTGSEQSALEFCFELLAYIVLETRSDRDCPQAHVGSNTLTPSSLLSVIFSSRVMMETFLGEFELIKGDGSVCHQTSESKQEDMGEGIETGSISMFNTECIFSQRVGDLIVLALEHCEQFRTMTEFSYFIDKVFAICESCIGNPTASHLSRQLVLHLLVKLRPYVDEKDVVVFSEKILLHLQPICDSSAADFVASVLETMFLTPQSSEHLGSLQKESQEASAVLDIDDSAIIKLIELAVELGSTKLDHVTYSLLVARVNRCGGSVHFCQTSDTSCANHQADSKADDFIMGMKSLVTNLITPDIFSGQLVEERQISSSHDIVDAKLSPVHTVELKKQLHDSLQAKKLFTASDRDKLLPSCDQTDGLLPKPVLIKLLNYCLVALNPVRAKIAAILLNSNDAVEHLSGSAIQQLCERAEGESDHTNLYACMHLVEQFLSVLEKKWKGLQPSDDSNSAVKVARRRLWSRCCELIAGGQSPSSLQATCAHVMLLFCSLSSKARRRFKKLAEFWNEAEHWNAHQLLLSVQVACLSKDRCLTQLVITRAIGNITEMLATGGVGGRGCEEEESLVEWTSKLAQVTPSGAVSVTSLGDFVQHALRRRFACARVLQLLTVLIRCVYGDSSSTSLEDVSLETVYEMVWSHSEFLTVMCSTCDGQEDTTSLPKVKEQLVELLITMVELQPLVCRSSHITVLLGAYSATMSQTDRGLLYLIFLYEKNGGSVGDYRPFLWGPAALEQYTAKQKVGWLLWKQPDTQEVIELLDRERLEHSTLEFPLDVELEPVNPFLEAPRESDGAPTVPLYDPCFMLPLFSHLLDSSCIVDCRQFIGCGCLGYIVASLSSKLGEVRSAGSHALSRFCTHLEGAKFREKFQILMLIEVLKNSLEVESARLPSLFAVFVVKAASLFLYPENELYPVIARFVVSKPAMDLSDIPLYYWLLHSSSARCTSERVWMLRLLLDGLQCEEDYHLYRRRRVFAHIMAQFDSPLVDKEAKSIILQIIKKACAIPLVATDLVWNQGLLTWLQRVGIAKRELLVVLWRKSLAVRREQTRGRGHLGTQTHLPPLFEEELTLTV